MIKMLIGLHYISYVITVALVTVLSIILFLSCDYP